MKYTDIAIIGGGLAGSTAAAMLERAGISAILIDPHPVYPSDFRVEKLSGRDQLERFRKTGLAEMILRAATHDGENWIARFGYLLDKRPSRQYGLSYDALVNAIRAASAWRRQLGIAAAAQSARRRAEVSHSVLVIIIVVVAVAIGLIGRLMRRVALIVPQPAIHAVGGEQLGMRTALDRLAAGYHDDLVHLHHR
jgi:glycine/D-amino acid oxidase-like deaminating enzyme